MLLLPHNKVRHLKAVSACIDVVILRWFQLLG